MLSMRRARCRAFLLVAVAFAVEPACSTERPRQTPEPPEVLPVPAEPRARDTSTRVEPTQSPGPLLAPAVRFVAINGDFVWPSGSGQVDPLRFHLRGECGSARFSVSANKNGADGRVRATLYDTTGSILDDRVLESGADNDAPTQRTFGGCVSDHPDGRRLVVRWGAVVFLDAQASPHRPVLQTVFPTTSTHIVERTGPADFRWAVSDEDGPNFPGAVYSLYHEISFDGEHWRRVVGHSVALGAAGDIRLRAERFWFPSEYGDGPPGYGLKQVWLGTQVTDGFWAAHSVVGPFRVCDRDASAGASPTYRACLAGAHLGVSAPPAGQP